MGNLKDDAESFYHYLVYDPSEETAYGGINDLEKYSLGATETIKLNSYEDFLGTDYDYSEFTGDDGTLLKEHLDKRVARFYIGDTPYYGFEKGEYYYFAPKKAFAEDSGWGARPYVVEGSTLYRTKNYSKFDTGGYTGNWGPEGRLAMLHQKEIVLNAHDTENFLSAIEIVRSISDQIEAAARLTTLGFG
jgi:hypothetical protein